MFEHESAPDRRISALGSPLREDQNDDATPSPLLSRGDERRRSIIHRDSFYTPRHTLVGPLLALANATNKCCCGGPCSRRVFIIDDHSSPSSCGDDAARRAEGTEARGPCQVTSSPYVSNHAGTRRWNTPHRPWCTVSLHRRLHPLCIDLNAERGAI